MKEVMNMMIDTHCHLSNEDYDNLDVVIKHMDGNKMIISGADQKMNLEVLDMIKKYDNIYGTIGYHPEELDDYDISWLEEHIHDSKIVGIGEIGLDYHNGKDNADKQKECFIEQIELAKKYHMPIVIHSRDAAEDTLKILKEHLGDNLAVMHCYSYSVEIARELMKMNISLGIGGVVTFKNAKTLVDVVKEIPLDRLVLETDSPYLTPEPLRGTKNEPYNIYYVGLKIAEIKNISLDEVFKTTTENAQRIYKF